MAMKEAAQISKVIGPRLIWLKNFLLRSWEFPFLVLFLSPIQGMARINGVSMGAQQTTAVEGSPLAFRSAG
jgi:hypothetical protein